MMTTVVASGSVMGAMVFGLLAATTTVIVLAAMGSRS